MPIDFENPKIPLTIGHALFVMAEQSPNSLALKIIDDRGACSHTFTFRQVLRETTRRAVFLAKRYKPGERIFIIAGVGPEWLLLQYAVALAGLVLVACDAEAAAQDIRGRLRQTRSVALFHDATADQARLARISEACRDLPHFNGAFDLNETFNNLTGEPDISALPKVAATDPALILYTSGTTGKPKAVIHSHQNLLRSARMFGDRTLTGRNSIWGGLTPLHHIGGCVTYSIIPLTQGSAVCLFTRPDADLVLDHIEQGNVTIFWVVPTIMIALLTAQRNQARDISAIQAIIGGGADFTPGLVRDAIDAFGCPYQSSYGMTEILEISLSLRDDKIDDLIANRSAPYDGVFVSVRDMNNETELPTGEIGRIFVRGYCLFLGYCGENGEADNILPPESWFDTGDIGSVDDRGYVNVTARLKDVIKRGGETISPVAIETAIMGHKDVVNVSVVGLPSLMLGETVAAFIQIRGDVVLTHADLVAYCRARLSRTNVPASFYLLRDFPLTDTGKIKKQLLKDGVENGTYRRLKTTGQAL